MSIKNDTYLVKISDSNHADHHSYNLGYVISLGICLFSLSFLTFLGNAMVVHVIRTERKLRTVSLIELKLITFPTLNDEREKKANFFLMPKNGCKIFFAQKTKIKT